MSKSKSSKKNSTADAQSAAVEDRQDRRQSKSSMIRAVVSEHPGLTAAEIAAEVKKRFGADVVLSMVYSEKNRSSGTRTAQRGRKTSAVTVPKILAAFRTAKQLVREAGSPADAAAILKALED